PYRRLSQIAVFILYSVDKFYISFVFFRLLIHQIEHTLGAGCSVYNEVDLLADLRDRICKALVESYKCNDSTDSDACQSVNSKNCSHDRNKCIADPSDICINITSRNLQ